MSKDKRYRDAATGAYVTEHYAKENPSTTVSESDENFEYGWAVVDGTSYFEVFKDKTIADSAIKNMSEELAVRKIKYVFVDSE